MSKCSRHHSQHVYHASAYGLAGEFERPSRHSIPTQAATVLGASGGRGFQRVENFQYDGTVSFKSAIAEVGGSFDECHNRHTSYATSIVEGLNVLDVVTADRVVSRMAIYSAEVGDEEGEASFDITGSHFVNLKIAGHKIDVKLATHVFHEHDTYSKIAAAQAGKLKEWSLWSQLGKLSDQKLKDLEETYHAVRGVSSIAPKGNQGGSYWFSPANHLKLEDHVGEHSELLGAGAFVFVPKFGVIRLAEMAIHKNCRTLTMLRVQMCSTGTGGTDVGGVHGSGGVGGP